MKTILSVILIIFLAACSNPAENEQPANSETNNDEQNISKNQKNLINFNKVTENYWINYEGSQREDEKMLHTDSINYDPSKEYSLNIDAYVSYYQGDEFLETVLHIEEKPQQLETIEEADNIILSFKKSFNDASLIEK